MLLYSLDQTSLVKDPETGDEYQPDESGAFDLPDAFALKLHAQHIAGKKVWETVPERWNREEAARLEAERDPITQVNLLREAVAALQGDGATIVRKDATADELRQAAAALNARADAIDPPAAAAKRGRRK